MKNLFNNISQEEKQRILEMHTFKKNVVSEQFEVDSNPRPNQNINIVGKTVNLYRDRFSKELMFQIKIISDTQDPVSKKVNIGLDFGPFNKKENKKTQKLELIFDCKTSYDKGFEIKVDGKLIGSERAYNPNLVATLLKKYCSTNDNSEFVPKADFAMNNQSTDTTTGIA